MIKRIFKMIIALFIFMMVNKVYALNQNLIINNNVNTKFLNLDNKVKVKVNVIDNNTGGNIVIKGIKFKIKNKDTNQYVDNEGNFIYETDETGSFMTTNYIEEGNYVLEEIVGQQIPNYLWNRTGLEFTVSPENDYVYIDNEPVLEINFRLTEGKGGFNIFLYGETYYIKENRLVFPEYQLPSGKFKLYAADNIYSADKTLIYRKDQLINEYSFINKNFKVTNLYYGKYYLVQTGSNMSNVFSDEPYYFDINYQDELTECVIVPITIYNHIPKGSLIITNKDALTDEVISNTKIDVYTDKNELIYSGRTDENGELLIPDLALLKYYFVVSETGDGYILNPDKVFFQITEEDQVLRTTITNEMIKGTFVFTKIDYTTGDALANALIGIYNINDELIYSGYTNELGKITLENLKYGKYYFKELEAPEGYKLSDEIVYFEITTDGEVVEGNMTNEKTDIPNTYQDENYLWLVIALVLFFSGGLLIFYAQKKH